MTGKMPFMPVYWAEWKSDPQLNACDALARGIWFELCLAMWARGRCSSLTGTAEQLAADGRCSPAEMKHAIAEYRRTGTADVLQQPNGAVTLVSRRALREEIARKGASERQDRRRGRTGRASVTPSVTSLSRYISSEDQRSEDDLYARESAGEVMEGIVDGIDLRVWTERAWLPFCKVSQVPGVHLVTPLIAALADELKRDRLELAIEAVRVFQGYRDSCTGQFRPMASGHKMLEHWNRIEPVLRGEAPAWEEQRPRAPAVPVGERTFSNLPGARTYRGKS